MNSSSNKSNSLQLVLGTGAFALCFAVFGSVSAMMPVLKKQFHLAPVQTSIAMAIPVLLGSLGRIPLGLLADRVGGRKVFTWTMIASVIAALLMGKVETYSQLLLFGFFTGIALASFSVGVAFISGWYPPEKQGFALGIYGAGNVGQSLAALERLCCSLMPGSATPFGVSLHCWPRGVYSLFCSPKMLHALRRLNHSPRWSVL